MSASSINNSELLRVLRADDTLFRQLVDLLPHFIWTSDAAGLCDFASKRWEEFTGRSADEHLGEGWTEWVHPDDVARVVATWRRAVANGEDVKMDTRFRRYDGEYRWFDTRAVALRDADGIVAKWLGTSTEVHDVYSARDALAKNEERLRFVTLATHDAVYDWDIRGGTAYRNDAFTASFDALSSDDAEKRWWKGHVHLDDRERIVAGIRAAFGAHEATWKGEYRLRRLDGSYAIVSDHAYLLYSDDGRPQRMIGAIADISDRKQVEQSLRDMQACLLSALEAGGLATWIWDVKASELIWDDAAWRLWGQRRGKGERVSVERLMSWVHPDDRERLGVQMAEYFGTGIDKVAEFRAIGADGVPRWLLSKGQSELDQAGKPLRMAGVYVDITERRRVEEARLSSQKMEALGTLAGGIAHDFNNILLAISGNSKLALEDLRTDEPDPVALRRSLVEIEKASLRATDLVRRILTFSRQQSAQQEAVRLRPLVEDSLRLLRATLPASVKIRSKYGDVGLVAADAIQIQQVIMNLITNAAHAIGEREGIIEIEVSDFVANSTVRGVQDISAGHYACITVRDNGHGIDDSIIDRIFEPFFTTKETGQGTGLGLAVVHGIVKTHGGGLVVDSEPNKGSAFHVFFPITATESLADPSAIAVTERGQGERILYVDDEEALVFLISRVLERLGYQVTGCLDPELAIKDLRADPQSYDVVVTDLSMRGMNGFELTRKVRSIRKDLPVVLTSGYLRNEDREAAQRLGIRELILKPNTVEELGASLHRVLRELGKK